MAPSKLVFIPLWISTVIQDVGARVSVLSKNEQLKQLFAEKIECEFKIAHEPYNLEGLFCNRTWDNIVCWPDTPAGQVAKQPCPPYINMFDQGEYVTRRCTEDGTWWENPDTNTTWSNYSACIKAKDDIRDIPQLIKEHMPSIKLMYTIGYSLSLTTLILALTIMIYFKRLHCPRNIIHINMFFAFGIRSAFSLMKNVLLVDDLGFANDVNRTGDVIKFVQEGTHWECKLFFTLFYYIIFASVMWIFNEGLYLQLILSVAVFADKAKVRWFVLLGWVLPLVFVVPWVFCRIYLDDMLCWNVHVYRALYWILHGPMVASVALNFGIFINIVRMLFTKLRAVNCSESKVYRYRKLAKSTLILIPLFAVYYMIVIWLPDDISPPADLFRMYVEMLFNSFQGFMVALLFCFLNHEVQYEIRKKWQRRILRQTGSKRTTMSHHSFFHRSSMHRDYQSHDHTMSKLDKKHGGFNKPTQTPLKPIAEEHHSGIRKEKSIVTSNGETYRTQISKTDSRHNGDVLQPLVTKTDSPQLPTYLELEPIADVNSSEEPQEVPLVICNENYTGVESCTENIDKLDPLHLEKPEELSNADNIYKDSSDCAVLPVEDLSNIPDTGSRIQMKKDASVQNGTTQGHTADEVNKDSVVSNGFIVPSKDLGSFISDKDSSTKES